MYTLAFTQLGGEETSTAKREERMYVPPPLSLSLSVSLSLSPLPSLSPFALLSLRTIQPSQHLNLSLSCVCVCVCVCMCMCQCVCCLNGSSGGLCQTSLERFPHALLRTGGLGESGRTGKADGLFVSLWCPSVRLMSGTGRRPPSSVRM